MSDILNLEPVNALPDDGVSLFERLARDERVDVEKLERLIAMHERVSAQQAKAAFAAAFSMMQADMPEISERGQIIVKGQVRSHYATLEDIHEAIKPLMKQYGFAMRHRTEWPTDKPNIIRIVGILSHDRGHSEESSFEAPMDRSDFRTDIQSMGSTVSYGRRYTTLDLLNIATRRDDDDGARRNVAPKEEESEPEPAGLDDWWSDLTAVADEGHEAFAKMWNASKKDYRTFVTKWRNGAVTTLKRHAATRNAAKS